MDEGMQEEPGQLEMDKGMHIGVGEFCAWAFTLETKLHGSTQGMAAPVRALSRIGTLG